MENVSGAGKYVQDERQAQITPNDRRENPRNDHHSDQSAVQRRVEIRLVPVVSDNFIRRANPYRHERRGRRRVPHIDLCSFACC